MTKTISIILAGVLVTMFCSFALAEEKKKGAMSEGIMQGSMMGRQGMMSKEDVMGKEAMMMHKKKMMWSSPMMHQMMQKEMVATKDGGVIVMVGNKLLKYDKDLNLKKEVKIKIDKDDMKSCMAPKKKKCPGYKMKTQGGMTEKDKERTEE